MEKKRSLFERCDTEMY